MLLYGHFRHFRFFTSLLLRISQLARMPDENRCNSNASTWKCTSMSMFIRSFVRPLWLSCFIYIYTASWLDWNMWQGILNAEYAECPKVLAHVKRNICTSLPRDMVGKECISSRIHTLHQNAVYGQAFCKWTLGFLNVAVVNEDLRFFKFFSMVLVLLVLVSLLGLCFYKMLLSESFTKLEVPRICEYARVCPHEDLGFRNRMGTHGFVKKDCNPQKFQY